MPGSQAREVAPGDLTICDREPITRPERIQSFGLLLVVSPDWTVLRASENIAQYLGVEPRRVIGRSLDVLVDPEALHEVRNRLHGAMAGGAVERLYGIELIKHKPAFDLAIHYVDRVCVIEAEVAGLDNRLDAASLVRRMIAKLAAHPTLDGFTTEIARQIRALTGFDRVMIYRFATDGTGEVVAEALKSGMDPFLGLRYPATDIPVQARALYVKNAFRIIADVDAPTSSILAAEGTPPDPMDLSLAVTRAVSPIHLEYLRNMGVRASLSISLIVEGELWGLIACHNETPKLPSFVIRTASELFGLMVSMTLESRLRLTSLDYQRESTDRIARIVAAVAATPALLANAEWLHGAIRPIIPCDGLAIYRQDTIVTAGLVPSIDNIKRVAQALAIRPPREIVVTDYALGLIGDLPEPDANLAGLLSMPIGKYAGEYVLLCRREQRFEIRWAGEAHERTHLALDDPKRLSPRKSFAAFVETVRGHSLPFLPQEVRSGEAIRAGLIEMTLRASIDDVSGRIQDGNRQELLIAELNHRVRNVLALIRGLINQTQGEEGDSASYVRSLSGRVQALARAHDRVTRQNWGPGPFNAIFEDEIAAYVPTQRNRFTIKGPFVFLEPQAYSTMALVVHELVSNSAKYGSLSDHGHVEVSLALEAGKGLHVRWLERGGPLVKPPTRRGFGSIIIERVVPFDLQGTAEVTFAEAGIDARFLIPEKFVASGLEFDSAATRQTLPAHEAAPPLPRREHCLSGRQVVVVEDNLIVALGAEEIVRNLGASAVHTVSTVTAAQALLAAHPIGFAVLDINLGVETSFSFAASLRDAGIPFIFTSGYGEGSGPTGRSSAELIVTKPYDRESLTTAIEKTLDGPAQR